MEFLRTVAEVFGFARDRRRLLEEQMIRAQMALLLVQEEEAPSLDPDTKRFLDEVEEAQQRAREAEDNRRQLERQIQQSGGALLRPHKIETWAQEAFALKSQPGAYAHYLSGLPDAVIAPVMEHVWKMEAKQRRELMDKADRTYDSDRGSIGERMPEGHERERGLAPNRPPTRGPAAPLAVPAVA